MPSVHVRDPLNLFQTDFFTQSLHLQAQSAVSSKALYRDPYTIRTYIPLSGCEPLAGMRSMTCSDFTVFSLIFRTGPLLSELAKYSNGATAITSHYTTPIENATVTVHAKSSGFDETSSSRVQFDKQFTPAGHSVHLAVDTPDLERPAPILTLGSSIQVTKNVSLISQISQELAQLDTVSIGAKFQPCGHMHAGVGAAVSVTPKNITIKSIQSSLYFGTHSGGSFAALGSIGLDGVRGHSLKLAGTTLLKLKYLAYSPTVPSDPSMRSPSISIPYPVLGFNYDVLQDTASAYMDVKLSASDAKRAAIDISLKMGVHLNKDSWKEPGFSLHLNASEL